MKNELRMNRDAVYVEKPPFPHNMLVELANICNHRCIFCGYKNMVRKKRYCDKPFTKGLIKQAYNLGTREIGFYLIGEPLISPDLEEYIAYASELGFEYIYLTTNGALAFIERTKKLVDAGLNSIKFSINAATPETYKKIHGSDDYLIVRQNVRDLRNYICENNIDLKMFISFVRTTFTESTKDKIAEDFGDYVDKIYFYDCCNQGGSMSDLVEDGVVKEGELLSAKSPCEMVFNRLHITCEGYLDACCADVNGLLAAVDLHKSSLYDAWYSDALVNLRRKFLRNDLQDVVCYNCVNNTDEPVLPLNEELFQGFVFGRVA